MPPGPGRVKFYPLGVMPVTTTATVVQNPIENPGATCNSVKKP